MFNIIHTYYNEEAFLKHQLYKYQKCNNYFNKIIIVDDASRKKAAPIVDQYNISIDLYRVLHDIGFNSHGCRNLAMDKTDSDWNLLIDIDWDIDIETIGNIHEAVSSNTLNSNSVYSFNDKLGREAINTFLIHKDTYWKATGYDEELTNMHTGDDLFYESLRDCGATFVKTGWKVTPMRKGRKIVFYDGDITVYDDTNMLLYQPGNKPDWDTLRGAVSRRNKLKGLKPIITFSYEKC